METRQKAEPEQTFRDYSQDQGAYYAQHRRDYHPRLYANILDYHKEQNGQFDTVIDVGCGPGIAIQNLAPHFKIAIGLDPSEGMIKAARSIHGPEKIRFEVSSAEGLGTDLDQAAVQINSVDLITAATCAHWFDMPRFWSQAAKVLKPGGTVALWASCTVGVDSSTPNYTAIQAVFDAFDEQLVDYLLPGNLLTRDLYRTLPLPWTSTPPVPGFDQSGFVRTEWNTGPGSEPMGISAEQGPFSLSALEKMVGTSSPVARWREAHPNLVGTEKDVVKLTRRKIEQILQETGVKKGEEVLQADSTGVLLLLKKNAN